MTLSRFIRLSFVLLICPWAGSALSQTAAEPAEACNCAEPVEAATPLVTAARIAKFAPRARADLALAIAEIWAANPPPELDTEASVQHFMAQIATETGGFLRLDENMNYSARRLLQVFPRRVSPEQAQRLAHRPERIANHVYGGRLGNREPGDGWRYRGSGYMQLTGRANFRERGRMLGLPFEEDPDLVRNPTEGFKAAVSYWASRRINDAANRDNIVEVRRLINGGTNGLQEARIWRERARRIFVKRGPEEAIVMAEQPGAPTALGPEELAVISEGLVEQGLLERGLEEAGAAGVSSELSESLRDLQIQEELPVTGEYDVDTLYALGTPDPVDPVSDEEVAAVQRRLQELNIIGPEEAAGPDMMSQALQEYQLREGLPITGIYDNETLESLLP